MRLDRIGRMERYDLADISPMLDARALAKAFQRRTGEGSGEALRTSVTRAAPPGEGLLGAVYRVDLASNAHRASFVLKALVRDELLRRTLRSAIYFERELVFYEEILPLLVDVQMSTGAKERLQNAIPLYYGARCDGANDYMVLEDLAESGCAGPTPGAALTRPQLGAALRALAHLHACSFAMRALRPEAAARVAAALRAEVYYSEENRQWYLPYLASAIRVNTEAVAQLEPPGSPYRRKFEALEPQGVYAELMTMGAEGSEQAVVLNGDAWAPNFMFSKDRAVLLDFQTTRFGSAACDLAYLLLACADESLTRAQFAAWVDEYHDTLGYFLNDMRLDVTAVFSRGALEAELRRWGRCALLMCLSTIPLAAGPRCDTLRPLGERFPVAPAGRVPLERLWPLAPYTSDRHRLRFVNALRLAVDSNFL